MWGDQTQGRSMAALRRRWLGQSMCRLAPFAIVTGLGLAMQGAQADEADLTVLQDPLYVELSTCLMGSLTQHAIVQERRDGISIEAQRQRYRGQVGENALMEQFLTQLYATNDPSELLVELNSRCVANMVGLPQEQAAACYRQFLLPFYSAIMAQHTGGLDTAMPRANYLTCMKEGTRSAESTGLGGQRGVKP